MSTRTAKLTRKVSEEDCQQWFQNRTVNPLTGRNIQVDGPTYNKLADECNKYENNPVNSLYNLVWRYDGSSQMKKTLNESLMHPTVNLEGVYGPHNLYLPFVALRSKSPILVLSELDKAFKARLTAEQYKQIYLKTLNGRSLLDELITYPKIMKAFIDLLPFEVLNELKFLADKQKASTIVSLITKSFYDSALAFIRKVNFVDPSKQGDYNLASLWAGARGQVEIYQELVNKCKVDPNHRDSSFGNTAFLFALQSKHIKSISDLMAYVNSGASIYVSSVVTENFRRNTDFNILTAEATPKDVMEAAYDIITRNIKNSFDSKKQPQITSEDVHNFLRIAIMKTWRDTGKVLIDNIDEVVKQAYIYTGFRLPSDAQPVKRDTFYGPLSPESLIHPVYHKVTPKTKELISFPTSWWLTESNLNQLKVKILHTGQYHKEQSARRTRAIYEIYLYHEGLQMYVGMIGSFIKILPTKLLIVPELSDHRVLEKALQRLHTKRKLLLPIFPYQSKIELSLFDARLLDEVKMGYPSADRNPMFDIDSKVYMNMLLSVKAALTKEKRFIPQDATGVVKKTYSKAFDELMTSKAKMFEDADVGRQIAKALLKEKSDSDPSSEDKPTTNTTTMTRNTIRMRKDYKATLIERLEKEKETVKGVAAYTKAIKSLQSVPSVRSREDLANVRNVGKKLTALLTPVFEEAEKEEALPTRSSEKRRRVSAQKKIAKFMKNRLQKLTKYFEDSIKYMNALPQVKRRIIYRALNGHIMQGPFSPIKRVDGLLYAKIDGTDDLKTMIEVVARSPPLPIRYKLYRGMHIDPPPIINKTTIYQEIPFSTTFLSMYALGWVLAKKNTNCCLFELQCHTGTKGLFLSKLPWMDPWTSANAGIFNRIAPDNVRGKFHIKVNAQNEFLMFPYRLKVVGKRSRNFKTMLDEQLEKIDSHYEFDASQRGLTSLFENNADLLNKVVDVYTLELQPISLYMVDLTTVPSNIQKLFEPSLMLKNPMKSLIYGSHPYYSLFYSPEELSSDVVQNIESTAQNNNVSIVKLIEKGRYVGPKTYEISE